MTYLLIACQIFVKFTAGDIVNVVVWKVDTYKICKIFKQLEDVNTVIVNMSVSINIIGY